MKIQIWWGRRARTRCAAWRERAPSRSRTSTAWAAPTATSCFCGWSIRRRWPTTRRRTVISSIRLPTWRSIRRASSTRPLSRRAWLSCRSRSGLSAAMRLLYAARMSWCPRVAQVRRFSFLLMLFSVWTAFTKRLSPKILVIQRGFSSFLVFGSYYNTIFNDFSSQRVIISFISKSYFLVLKLILMIQWNSSNKHNFKKIEI